MVPVIVGPGEQRFLIDHHHLARALHDEGVDSVFVTIVADFHKLDAHEFWNMMDFHGWTHPFDGKGRRRDYADLPKTVKDMEDDPYRSLAGQLRNIGGYAKDSHAVLGIRLGRFPAPPHQAQGKCARIFPPRSAPPSTSPSRKTRAIFPAGARRTKKPRALAQARAGAKRRSPDKVAHED